MELPVNTLQQLAELLRPPEPAVLQGEDLPKSPVEISSCRDTLPLNKVAQPPTTVEEYEQLEDEAANDTTKSLEADCEEPPYTMCYRQAVSAEDVFLQLGGKGPGSASCEKLVVRVQLSGTRREHVNLDVREDVVSVTAPRHRLRLPLPHRVAPHRSSAQWESDTETLVLTLQLDREFDFVNF